MKRAIHTLCAAALLLAATACEDTLQTTPAATGDGPTLTLRIDNTEEDARTRTSLDSADPKHNVQSIRILIFRGEGDDATFFAAEEDAQWSSATDGGESPNSMTYTLKKALVSGQTYTLLGVGMDDTFNNTYTIDQNTTLGQTYARLKDGQSPAQCEFFTGIVSFTHQGKHTQMDDLLLRRRVAGVMLYVKEIPQLMSPEVGTGTDLYRVTSVKLELPVPQKSSVLLKRDFTDPEWREPDGQDAMTEESEVLAQIDLSGYTYTDGKDFYLDAEGKPATGYTGVYMLPLNLTENLPTFTVRLYGKPLKAQDGTGTVDETAEEKPLSKEFVVENRSESNTNTNAFDIRSNYIYCIGKKGEGIDDPISLSGKPIYVKVQDWQKVETGHDFGPARVQAVFDDTENPIYDCINQTFKVKILPPLSTIRDNVESISLTLSGKTYVLNEQGETVEIEEDLFENDKDELERDDKIDLYGNWLYIKQEDNNTPDEDGTYGKSLTANFLTEQLTQGNATGIEVTFFITDYARPRRNWGWKYENLASGEYSWQPADADVIKHIDNDIRYMDVILSTKIKNVTYPRTDTLTIRQYNTITVCYNPNNRDDQWANCGFRRKDVYSPDAAANKLRVAWKFNRSGSTNSEIYGGENNYYNGWANLDRIGWQYPYTGNTWSEEWNSSAMQEAQTLFRKISEGKIVTHIETGGDDAPKSARNNGECWYLPALYEMEGLITMVSSNINGHLKNHEEFYITETENQESDVMGWYWTSTLPNTSGVVDTYFTAYACRYLRTSDGNEKADTWKGYARYNTGLIRQARRFPDQLNKGY